MATEISTLEQILSDAKADKDLAFFEAVRDDIVRMRIEVEEMRKIVGYWDKRIARSFGDLEAKLRIRTLEKQLSPDGRKAK